jgi:probable HAF family extracellular repeat protein
MIINDCFNVRSLILAAALISGLGLVTHATAQEAPYLVDLNTRTTTPIGTLGSNYSIAFDINDAGQVVGGSYTAEGNFHVFITGPGGIGMKDLGTLRGYRSVAQGVNNVGQVWDMITIQLWVMTPMPSSLVLVELV